MTKKVATEFIPDKSIAAMIEGVAERVENQADADHNATIGDRLKQGGIVSTVKLACI